MVTLRDRANALETQFAYEQSFLFCAQSRRNRLLGLWVADQLGETDPQSFADALCDWSIAHFSDEELITKVSQEFDRAERPLDLDGLTNRMHTLLGDVMRDMRLA
ncbi:ATPase inhibitor subunit zeta [Affinirhizobium pseudoryzae]|jgi:hypothetical protein|uniref:ATPase inhibitor subunit zeta n=1 Tax=Allorhizobium pseudoryzae TaxID=379684 RepID=UPI0013EA40FD|nr:ATPase inhibitor subunit zeta [Allorhizobium pseudoryzae]